MTIAPVPTVTVPTYADGTRLSIQLFTVEDSGFGPYVALPLMSVWTPNSAHLFTRATAELIVTDLERDECGISATFADDGALTFTYDGGTRTVKPDAYGRYAIGGLWSWDEWGDHVPHTAGQAAFAQGAAEYRQADAAASLPLPLDGLYSRGREEAHQVTLHTEEPDGAAPDDDAPGLRLYGVTWAIDDIEATSPREAARIAYGLICRDLGPDDDTHIFDVRGPNGTTRVDLDHP